MKQREIVKVPGCYEFTGIALWYNFTGNYAMVRLYCDLHWEDKMRPSPPAG